MKSKISMAVFAAIALIAVVLVFRAAGVHVSFDGGKTERPTSIPVNAPAAASTTPASQASRQPDTGPSQPLEGEVFDNGSLSAGLDMGVNTSNNLTNWVTPEAGGFKFAYPPKQAWGAVFVTVGTPTEVNKPSRDYSQYNTLELEMRGWSGGERVAIGVKDWRQPNNGMERKTTIVLSREWSTHKVRLADLAPVNIPARPASDLTHLYVVCEFVFETVSETAYVRRIRYSR